MRHLFAGFIAASSLALTGCGYNNIQTQDEEVKAAWSEVVNQYQRRADLIPNLVNTVKGFAAKEQAVMIGVTNAPGESRSPATDTSSPERQDAAVALLASVAMVPNRARTAVG